VKDSVSLHMLNVGYGDAFLFKGAGGTCLLDAGGNLPEEFTGDSGRMRVCDWFAEQDIKHIDHLIISHIHEDHLGGLLPLLEQVTVTHVWTPFPVEAFAEVAVCLPSHVFLPKNVELFVSSLEDYLVLLEYFEFEGTQVHQLRQGDVHMIGDLNIEVLSPAPTVVAKFLNLIEELSLWTDEENDQAVERQIALLDHLDKLSNGTSFILKISFASFVGLFCADNTPQNWQRTAAVKEALIDVNVLKLPHHGQIDSIDPFFMEDMPLRLCLTTSSSTCKYNSAAPIVYEQLKHWAENDGRDLLCLFSDPPRDHPFWQGPDRYASIEISTDGTFTYQLNN
jgi:beta-lactamase superfamily II metal-dependent hydrolase